MRRGVIKTNSNESLIVLKIALHIVEDTGASHGGLMNG
jgi:hypothetical protein